MRKIIIFFLCITLSQICFSKTIIRYEKLLCPKSTYVIWAVYKDGGGCFISKKDAGYKLALKKNKVIEKKYRKTKKSLK